MKKIWLFIAAIAVISCKNEALIDYAVVSGKIMNKGENELTIKSNDQSFQKVVNVLEDGSFVDTLKVKEGVYKLYDGKNITEVYVNTGANVNISYDADDFSNTLTITGIGAEISNYLYAKGKKEKKIRGDGTRVYELNEKPYKAKFSEIRTALEELIGSTAGISEEFKAKERRALNYYYLGKLNIYERYHAHYAKLPEFKITEGFLDELKELTYEIEEDFIFSTDYKNIVTSHYYEVATKLTEKDSIAEDIAFLNAAGTVTNEFIKNSLLYNNAKYSVTYTNDLETFYSTFNELSTNDTHKTEITESYNKLIAVSKGKLSPKFVGYENFEGETTSLDDLKGKYVYVDVWATWCGPCKREIPFLKDVEKKYHDKNIEFVSISVDKAKDHDKWLKMVKEKELKGIQLFADKDWESDFVKGYLIKGIPRFILIDPNGNIVNSNAPRPSEDKLIDTFNELGI